MEERRSHGHDMPDGRRCIRTDKHQPSTCKPAQEYVCPVTEALSIHAITTLRYQQFRVAMHNRGTDLGLVQGLQALEDQSNTNLTKALRMHPLYPWLQRFPGMAGAKVAALVGILADPRRFVGPDGKWTRRVWSYLGFRVDDGKMPRRKKGEQSNWNTKARTLCLMPGGIAEQVVRLGAAREEKWTAPKKGSKAKPVLRAGQEATPYRLLYEETKARLIRERGYRAGRVCEIEETPGPDDEGTGTELGSSEGMSPTNGGAGAGEHIGSDRAAGPSPTKFVLPEGRPDADPATLPYLIHLDKIARTVAVKAFVADMVREWLRLVGAE
jgi:hypothetical protein